MKSFATSRPGFTIVNPHDMWRLAEDDQEKARAAMMINSPVVKKEKFRVNPSCSLDGSLRGYVSASFKDLVRLLGKPILNSGSPKQRVLEALRALPD